jgi:phage major head subunit gpT-like protein
MPTQANNYPRITSRGILGDLMVAIGEARGLSWINKIAQVVNSDQEIEEYAWLGAPPSLRERIGELLLKRMRENTMAIRNRKYESSMLIPADWLKRDKTGQVQQKIAEQKRLILRHDASNLSTFITNGTGATSGLAYDGQYFFDTDHAEGSSGEQINLLTASQVTALNVGTATDPTPAEVCKAVLGVIGYMMNYKDDRGEITINDDAAEFLVMTTPALMNAFVPAFGGAVIANGTGGIDNPLVVASKVVDGFKVDLAINPRLAYTTQFAVFRTDAPAKPLIIQQEGDIEYSVLDENSDHYKKNDELVYITKRSCYWGFGPWQYAAHATMS